MRQDTWAITLTIDGEPLGIWDQQGGGEIDSEETTYRPGGMAPRISLGGSTTVGNVTLTRLCDRGRDWDLLRRLASTRVGKAECIVAKQPLDTDGNPWGRPLVYRGKLKTVTPPETDSNSSDAATWEITVTPEGNVS